MLPLLELVISFASCEFPGSLLVLGFLTFQSSLGLFLFYGCNIHSTSLWRLIRLLKNPFLILKSKYNFQKGEKKKRTLTQILEGTGTPDIFSSLVRNQQDGNQQIRRTGVGERTEGMREVRLVSKLVNDLQGHKIITFGVSFLLGRNHSQKSKC